MEEIRKYLEVLGFSQKVIDKYLSNPIIKNINEKRILTRIKENFCWLKANGYTDKEIALMGNKSLNIISNNVDVLENKKQFFLSLGYSEEDYHKILNKFPIILGLSNINILEKISYFLDLGLTREEFIKKSTTFPQIFGYNMARIKEREQLFLNLGYTKEEYKQMVKRTLMVFCCSKRNIINRFNLFINKGFSKEEVIYMTVTLPPLYTYSEENITEKLTFFQRVDLKNALLAKPLYLMMNSKLLRARFQFLEDKGIAINKEYYEPLFYNNRRFRQKFGITKEELIILPYQNETKKLGD